MAYIHLHSVDSTNSYAKKNIGTLIPNSLIIADTQTDGRGRTGNSFYSPLDTGLYMTMIVKENASIDFYTPMVAVAVRDVISEYTDKEILIKWVNDLFADQHKICGILCERVEYSGISYIIIGIGVNLTTNCFPDEIPNAGSLNIDIDKETLAKSIYQKIYEFNFSANNEYVMETYKKNMFLTGKTISFSKDNIKYQGKVDRLLDNYSINVLLSDGNSINLNSGEIHIINF